MSSVIVLGLNHKTAPVEIREKFSFTEKQREQAYNYVLPNEVLQECAIITTCNRTEIYALVPEAEAGRLAILNLFKVIKKDISPVELQEHSYFYCCQKAVTHLFRVTAGLDSMIVGETQILGQVRNAYEKAVQHGVVSKIFNALFRQAITFAKRVQSETRINDKATSVSYLAVKLAKDTLCSLNSCSVLLIGAGRMSELALHYLRDRGVNTIIVANRTRERAEKIAFSLGGKVWDYERLDECLRNVDIVITSTAAPHFVIKRTAIERAMVVRKNRPLFLIDIAVPRDVDPAIKSLKNVYLYNIDDLEELATSNMAERTKDERQAEIIITEGVAKFQLWLKTLEVVPLITALREKAEIICRTELERNLKSNLFEPDKKGEKSVEKLSKTIVNSIFRGPILRIKELATVDKSESCVDLLTHLFELQQEI